MNIEHRHRSARGVVKPGLALVLSALAFSACDFTVTNPGPIHDVNLDDPQAHAGAVNGAMAAVLRAVSEYGLTSGAVSRDHIAASHTGWAGTSLTMELGQFSALQTETTGWNLANNGRWIGEHMSARLREHMGGEAESYAPVGRFLLWGALGNRVLGEHSCTAVFEGTGPLPWTAYFERAVEMFQDAARVAGAAGDEEARFAALGGLASAHLYLANWGEAIAAAEQVPETFVFQGHYSTSNPDWYWLHDAAQNGFKAVTFWSHPFEDYFPETGDPRAAWGHDENVEPDVPRPSWGRIIPFYYPLKIHAPRRKPLELTAYGPPVASQIHQLPVNLVSGREMLLVRAEAILASGGDYNEAMALLNRLRATAFDRGTGHVGNYFTGEPLEPWTASSREEAWTHLKFERLIELNLEDRRFGDRKRWAYYDSPGELHPKEYLPDHFQAQFGVPRTPNVCFPLPQQEIDRNPDIPADFVDEIISG